MSYSTQCGGCVEYDIDEQYCSYYKQYCHPGDTCSYQKPRNPESGGPCCITTMLCDILGYTDNCYVITQMRKFRTDVMQKDPKYQSLLLEYDVVGPIISERIREDYKENGNKNIWQEIYKVFLSETANLTALKKYDEAINKFKLMIQVLKEYLCIKDVDLKSFEKGYDYTTGGHGYVKKIIIKEENFV